MSDVVCFGEILLRLSTPNHHRILTTPALELSFGGAEANVAVQLAALGTSASFVSRLPENPIANRCLNELRGLEVNTSHVVRGGERMGLYFLESGISQRATTVLYDRAHTAISEATPDMFQWNEILQGARWFHWSGITPALSSHAAAICRDACTVAKQLGLTVSFDVNFRSKLWSQKRAAEVLQPLMTFVDVCVCSESDAVSILGLKQKTEDSSTVAEDLAAKYGFQAVAMTSRQADRADQTTWSGILHTKAGRFESRDYSITIADRVGAGDSFTGTLIHSLISGFDPQRSIDLAVASSALKHTILGDYNRVTLSEIEGLVAGTSGGRVQR